jgi:hypothetical protein
MKTFTTSILGLTLLVVTLATSINTEAAFAFLAAAGVLTIAINDYTVRSARSING